VGPFDSSARTRTASPSSPAPGDPGADQRERFWRTHIRIGFLVFLGEGLAIFIYLVLTPGAPHRAVLFGMVTAWFAFAVINLFLVSKLVTSPWLPSFSAAWTALSVFAIGGFALLDNGLDSPVVPLLFLPISFAALSFAPAEVLVCGISTLLSAATVAVLDPGTRVSVGTRSMLLAGLAGASVLAVAAARNRSRRELHEQLLMKEIVALGSTDGLTGCAVHRVFHERLLGEISRSRRTGRPLSLMMIDVDGFKGINDTYGHLVGDTTLAAIGGMLRTHVRAIDLVGRVGGDEFAVLLPDTDPRAAADLADRLRRDLPSVLEIPATLSIGVSALSPLSRTSEQLLDDADLALYDVKRSGRDAVAVRLPGLSSPS